MKLNVKDRYMLEGILPKEGSIIDMLVVKDFKEKIEITKEDAVTFDIKVEGQGLIWNKEGQKKTLEIDISGPELIILKDAVDKLDKTRKITIDNLEICKEIKDLRDDVKKTDSK